MEKEVLNFKIFNNINKDLENLWIEFENKNNHHIFQKLTFIKYQINKKNNKYFLVVIYFREEVIAILPLEIESKFGFKILQWIGTIEFDYCGSIFSDWIKLGINKEIFLNLWSKILNDIKNYDLVFLDKQFNKIDNIKNPFVEYLNSFFSSKIFLIKLPKEEKEYLANIENKKFLSEFLRTEKKLYKDNLVEISNYETQENNMIPSDIIKKKLEILENKAIKNFLDKRMMDFFDLFQKENQESVLISVVKINKKIIAANLGLINNKRFYYYMPVLFAENFNKFSPGKILIQFLIKWNISRDIKIFDFGLGDENYKKYWSNHFNELSRHLDFRGFKGFILYLVFRIYLILKKK